MDRSRACDTVLADGFLPAVGNALRSGREHAGVKRKSSRRRLSREDWLAAARASLIRAGVEAVKMDHLATTLNVSHGSFYWHFKSHQELLDALLSLWVKTNMRAYIHAIQETPGDPWARLMALGRIVIDEKEFDPAFDMAVRDWGRRSARVRRHVKEVDGLRIQMIRELFRDMGFSEHDSLVRARITYLHQVGYYAVGIHESRKERLKKVPAWLQVLGGLSGKEALFADLVRELGGRQ